MCKMEKNRFLLSYKVLICFLFFLLFYPAPQVWADVLVIPSSVRVGLLQQVKDISFSVTGDYQLIDQGMNEVLATTRSDECWQVCAAGSQMELYRNGILEGTLNAPLLVKESTYQVAILAGNGALVNRSPDEEITVLSSEGAVPLPVSSLYVLSAGKIAQLAPTNNGLVTLYTPDGSHRYRGNMEFRIKGNGLTVINELPVEEYLYGVVPAEMPAYWPIEALKAQAVASRSYLLAQLGSYGKEGFDLLATQSSQVYRGYDWENPATTRAVQETKGVVLTYRGRPVNAVFHSSSGGFTENSEDVWKNRLEYLRARPDPTDLNDKHYNWSISYSQKQLLEQLNSKGYYFKKIIDLIELERTSTGARVKRIQIKGLGLNDESVVLEVYNADAVRSTLGLKSSLFTMEKELDQEQELVRVTFRGNGWGHGLGMSQYGALGLAREGYSYQDILKYYYSGATLSSNYGS